MNAYVHKPLTPLQPEPTGPYRAPPEPIEEVAPFDTDELHGAMLRPHRMIELVLVERRRLSKTVAASDRLATLAALLVVATIVLALPFGALLGVSSTWRVAALFLGSMLVCFPSLHVFSSYLGCRMSVLQNLVMALVITAVASMFALGFAPIVWFVGVSTPASSRAPATVATVLLCASIVAGMIHLTRCMTTDEALRPSGPYKALMFAWQLLFAFVAHRMGVFLELL